jgi:hypothetical protein
MGITSLLVGSILPPSNPFSSCSFMVERKSNFNPEAAICVAAARPLRINEDA